MLKHRDRRAPQHGAKIGPPHSGRPEKAAGRRRLLARSFGYASALHSLPAAFSGRSQPCPDLIWNLKTSPEHGVVQP